VGRSLEIHTGGWSLAERLDTSKGLLVTFPWSWTKGSGKTMAVTGAGAGAADTAVMAPMSIVMEVEKRILT
jgi:hypothetical protein